MKSWKNVLINHTPGGCNDLLCCHFSPLQIYCYFIFQTKHVVFFLWKRLLCLTPHLYVMWNFCLICIIFHLSSQVMSWMAAVTWFNFISLLVFSMSSLEWYWVTLLYAYMYFDYALNTVRNYLLFLCFNPPLILDQCLCTVHECPHNTQFQVDRMVGSPLQILVSVHG